jgi:hypothetical protein
MKQRNSILIGIAISATLILGACSKNNDDAASSDVTVDTRITPPTIAAGTQIKLGEFTSEIQELSDKCAGVLQPIRNLEKKYQSGLELVDADRPAFNDALSKGFQNCTPEEWTAFQEKELKGWMNAIPSDKFTQSVAGASPQDGAATTAPATDDTTVDSTVDTAVTTTVAPAKK